MQEARDPVATPRVALSRLKRRREFLRVAAARRKWVTPGLILQVAPTPPADRVSGMSGTQTDETPSSSAGTESPTRATEPAPPMARVGFTVSKKVGNSVARNRARRRLRAVADEILPLLAEAGMDYVIIGRTGTIDRPFDDLLADMRTAAKRVLTAKPDTGPPRGKRPGKIGGRKPPGDPPKGATSKGGTPKGGGPKA